MTKKEKEKDAAMEELMIITQTMVGGELHGEEAWSLKDVVEEAAQLALRKSKKKKTRRDEVVMHPQAPWWTQLRVQGRRQRKEKELGHAP